MQFISLALLGLAAFASAVPHPLEAGNVERSLIWTPRALRERAQSQIENRDNDKHSDAQLVAAVHHQTQKEAGKQKAKDNIRRSHYRNKDRTINTIIIVVTVVIDIRDPANQNTRYMKHTLLADNQQKSSVSTQVTETWALTVGKGNGKANLSTGQAQGKAATVASDGVAAAAKTADPNAPFASTSQGSQSTLLAKGAAAPSGVATGPDPAAILEDGYLTGFVELVVVK